MSTSSNLSFLLSPEFKNAAKDVVVGLIPNLISSAITTALAAGATLWIFNRKARMVEKNITEGFFLSSEAPLQRTSYIKSRVLNAKNEEYVDQQIRPIGTDPTIDLSNLFPLNVRKQLSKYLIDACEDIAKKAAKGQPYSLMVLDHLQYVVSANELKGIQGLIKAKMQTAGGTIFRGAGTNATIFRPAERQRPETEEYVTALVFEPGILRREMKLLFKRK
jgi:hypothetical protein